MRDKCFIISREKDRPNPKDYSDKYDLVTIHDTGLEYVVMFRKRIGAKPAKFIRIIAADQTFSWIDKVKDELKEGQKLVLYSQDEPINGLLGLVNCLRREPGGEIVYGLLIADPSAPDFNPDIEFYENQLDKDLAINIYQDVSSFKKISLIVKNTVFKFMHIIKTFVKHYLLNVYKTALLLFLYFGIGGRFGPVGGPASG